MNRESLLKGSLLTFAIIGMIGLPLAAAVFIASLFPEFFRGNEDAGGILMLVLLFVGIIPGQFLGGLVWAVIGKVAFKLQRSEVESIVFSGPNIRTIERWNRFCLKLLFNVNPDLEYGTLEEKYGPAKRKPILEILKTIFPWLMCIVLFYVSVYYLGVFVRYVQSLL